MEKGAKAEEKRVFDIMKDSFLELKKQTPQKTKLFKVLLSLSIVDHLGQQKFKYSPNITIVKG